MGCWRCSGPAARGGRRVSSQPLDRRALETGALPSLMATDRGASSPRLQALRVCAARRCQHVERGEGCRGRPAVVTTAGSPAQGQPHPGCQGWSRVSRNSQGQTRPAAGQGRMAQRPWGSALVTQSESVSRAATSLLAWAAGQGERKRVAFKESEIPSPASGLEPQAWEPERRAAGKSPGRTGPQGVFGEEVAGLGGDCSAHKVAASTSQ